MGRTCSGKRSKVGALLFHSMRLASALGVLVFFLAGCVSEPPSPQDADEDGLALDHLTWEELGALVFEPGHAHTDRELHVDVARGLQVLNRSTFGHDGQSRGTYIEADVDDGLIAVGIFNSMDGSMDTVLLDANALPALNVVGEFHEPTAYGDAKLHPGRPLAYVPGGDQGAFAIWDVTDPASPRRIGDAPGACHMTHPQEIAGVPYVWCSLGGATAYRIEFLPDGSAQGVPVGTALPQSDPEIARYATYYQSLTPIGPALTVAPHDMTAQEDPLTGEPILVVASELHGIRVYDVGVPLAPIEISAWRGDGMDATLERLHTVGLFEHDGRRIGVGTTETFTSVEPAMYIVDFTDYANPEFLARWVPPGIEHDDTLTYSLHNFQAVGDRLYVTNFHGGLWVLDITDPAAPEEVALRVPVWDAGNLAAINEYWDVLVVNGYVLVTDMSSGVEVLHIEGDPAGDPDWIGFT